MYGETEVNDKDLIKSGQKFTGKFAVSAAV
jgi:hypothetical protein